MRIARKCSSLYLVIGTCLMTVAVPSAAEVTIRGTVEYWDRIRGDYFPAQRVRVRAVGNWIGSDPRGHTDDRGRFNLTQRNPRVGQFDIAVKVYARTYTDQACKVRVSHRMWAFRPYHVTSATVERVARNGTATIDLKIGGPQNNAAETYKRTFAENANAFMLHQETMEHYRVLKDLDFPREAFLGTRIIAPAAGFAAYYNHASGYINMTYSTLMGLGYEFSAGTGDWTQINTAVAGDISYPWVLKTMRHEASHRLHDTLTPLLTPLGLNIPAKHHAEMETNRFLAYTEGVAEFLPRMTLGRPGVYESVPSPHSGPPGLDIPASLPPPGNYAWEGEVTGLLIDLCGPAGTTKKMRFPATESVTGVAVPEAVQAAQEFALRISDPDLSRVRNVISMTTTTPLHVQTVREFLSAYHRTYPREALGLKLAAFNRCLALEELPQTAPYIDGSITTARVRTRLQLSFDIIEEDAEDRSIVKVYYWREDGDTARELIPPVTYATGWEGNRRSVTVQLPVARYDRLWVVVSDDMLSTAYCLEQGRVAEEAEPVTLQLPRPRVLQLAPRASLQLRHEVDAERVSQVLGGQTQAAHEARCRALRQAFERARTEIEVYAEHAELVNRIERGLHHLALTGRALEPKDNFRPGTIRLPLVPHEIAGGEALLPQIPWPVRGEEARGDIAMEARFAVLRGDDTRHMRWLEGIAEGSEPLPDLSSLLREDLAGELRFLSEAQQHRLGVPERVQAIRNDVRTALNALPLQEMRRLPGGDVLTADLERAVAELDETLTAVRTDAAQLGAVMETQQRALRVMSGLEMPRLELEAPTPRPTPPVTVPRR